MQLIYEDRAEMQRSLKKANIREVFMRYREGHVRVTALIDARILAVHEFGGSQASLEEEVTNWKKEHFEVFRGEVTTDRPSRSGG